MKGKKIGNLAKAGKILDAIESTGAAARLIVEDILFLLAAAAPVPNEIPPTLLTPGAFCVCGLGEGEG